MLDPHRKSELLKALMAKLQVRLDAGQRASEEAARHATDEESRAESKWDTQGLEASYLAAGQARQVRETAVALQKLAQNRERLVAASARVELGALVEVEFAGEADRFYITPAGGGEAIVEPEGTRVTVLTPVSPLFQALQGRRAGAEVVLDGGRRARVLTVV